MFIPFTGTSMLSDKDILLITHKADLKKEDLDYLFAQLEIPVANQDNSRRNADATDFKLESLRILHDWRQMKGNNATRSIIIESLKECDLTIAVQLLEKKWSLTTN